MKKTAIMKKSDAEALIVRVVSGDELAWQQFVEKFYGFLFSLASRYSRGDDDLAEELCVFVLENLRKTGTDGVTFARLRHYLASIERFGGRSRFTTWLALVARNVFRDWFRSRIGRRKKPSDDTDDIQQSELLRRWPTAYSAGRCRLDDDRIPDSSVRSRPDGMLELRGDLQSAMMLGQALRNAVERLPDKTRQVLLLHLVRGLEGEHIRRIMGFSSRQKVYDELARAKRLLRREVERSGFSPEEAAVAARYLSDVFSAGLFPDPDDSSVLNVQKG